MASRSASAGRPPLAVQSCFHRHGGRVESNHTRLLSPLPRPGVYPKEAAAVRSWCFQVNRQSEKLREAKKVVCPSLLCQLEGGPPALTRMIVTIRNPKIRSYSGRDVRKVRCMTRVLQSMFATEFHGLRVAAKARRMIP